MNLAYRDIKHNLLRFVLTNFGLSLLLGMVIVITGVYGGLVDDALRQARAANADLWIVQAGTNGPFAELSRLPGDTRELVSRVYGVERVGSVTYQSVQTELHGKPLRVFLIGFELDRPGGPRQLVAGRQIMRSHYEMIADRSTGLALGQELPLGTHGHKFTVVGLMKTRPRFRAIPWATSPCTTRRRSNSSSLLRLSVARSRAQDHCRRVIRSMPLLPTVDQNAAIICVTHDEMILDRFDHIFRLRDGRLESGAGVGFRNESATVN